VHVPGNYNKADYGGQEKQICMAHASLMKDALINLQKNNQNEDYKVTLEATHHGPLVTKPVFFIEIGSNEAQWKDKEAGRVIAKTVVETIKKYTHDEYEVAIGFGGTHYCAGFNKIELNTNIALSHICPKYAIMDLDKEMVQKMLAMTYEKVDYALIDWKGTNAEQRAKITKILEELKIRWKKTKQVKK
jgi:D-aminoacyl-tRNA deacylase